MFTTRRAPGFEDLNTSEGVLAELRRVIRVELMREFQLGPPLLRRVGIMPLPEARDVSTADRARVLVSGQAQQVARVLRVCVEQKLADGWTVDTPRAGTFPMLLGSGPMPATAFAPLPKWIVDVKPDELGPELVRALRDFPITNVEPITIQPGIQVGVELTAPRELEKSRPAVWLLCELPPAELGAPLPYGFEAVR